MAPEAPEPLTPQEAADSIKARALELGFAAAGITDLTPVPHGEALDAWIARGMAGTMRYMHRQAARRKAPQTIVSGAGRVVVVLYNYAMDDTTSPATPPQAGRVARYARGQDYHSGLAPALKELAGFIRELSRDDSTLTRVFVDAGPVPERELAQRAGLGWIGKNTMLIRPDLGSYTFIAAVFTDADLAIDQPFTADRCGSCSLCLEACPTEAFPAPRVLDARRCISYLTIEYRGDVPPELAAGMGSWVFGCDVCQEACPWNVKFAAPGPAAVLALEPAREWIPFAQFRDLDESGFAEHYGWTPLERPGLRGMRRNMDIAERNATESPS